jgi:hypothetical protein
MEEIEKRLKQDNDNDEPITIDYGSFFHYFEEKEDEFDVSSTATAPTSIRHSTRIQIGQTIVEEVFADAVAFFTGTHEHVSGISLGGCRA